MVRLMFQDEARFGRINKRGNCWCLKRIRPVVPSQLVREYRYAYGVVDPYAWRFFFWGFYHMLTRYVWKSL